MRLGDRWRGAHGRVLWERHLWALLHRVAASTVETLLRGAGGRWPRDDVAGAENAVYFLFNDAFVMGGTMRTAFGLAGHLAPRRPVTIVSVVRGDDTPFFAFPDGVALRVLDERRGGDPTGALSRALGRLPSVLTHPLDFSFRLLTLRSDIELLRFVRSLRAGTIITTRTSLALFIARFARPELTLVAQEHFHLGLYPPALRAEILRMYPRLDALGVLTRVDERAYHVLLGRGLERLAQIPNAVPELPGAVADARDRTVIAAGRLIPQKGFDLLVPAFDAVARRNPGWRLRIFGEGPERASLQALIDARGLQDRVTLEGASDALGEELARGGVFVLSSRHEGFPMVILEAMSKGMPIVSFDCPTGPGELITDGVDGVLVAPENVAGLSEALDRLIRDEAARARLGAAARQTAQRYALPAIGGRWETLLAEAQQARAARLSAATPASGRRRPQLELGRRSSSAHW